MNLNISFIAWTGCEATKTCAKVLYASAQNNSTPSMNSGWQSAGTFYVGTPPFNINPSIGSGLTRTFTFMLTQTAGWGSGSVADVVLNGSLDGRKIGIGTNRSISGRVTGDDATAIAGAYISLHLASPPPLGKPRQTQWGFRSGAGGLFDFQGLIDGEYRLCSQASDTIWLNPCEWGLPVPNLTLSNANPNSALRS